MSSTFRVLFYLRKNYVNKEGRASIMIRITIGGDMVQFSSKLDIEPHLWDTKTTRVIGKSGEAAEINTTLDNIRSVIINHYRSISDRELTVTAEKVRNAYLGVMVKGETLLQLFDKHIEDCESLVGISKSKSTLQKYKVTRTRVTDFMKKRYNRSDVSLKEVNHMFISDFDNFLRVEAKCNANTTAKFIQFFKRIIIIARNNGWLHHDPFANYKIKLEKVDRGFLTKEEIAIIAQKEFAAERLDQARDVFLFSCFCGLAYIDLKNLTSENIRTSFDGGVWIMTKRQKTNTPVNVPLLAIPKMILAKYKGRLPDGKILPIISNQKTNQYLKEIADVSGIQKVLTFHLARHTFATTTTLAKGIPIETVSKMLGHTNIKTTQIYARITNDKISKDMEGLSDQFTDIEDMLESNDDNLKKTGTTDK
ncbi:MAG: site-specific integrase [Rikenellaceae bacterium]